MEYTSSEKQKKNPQVWMHRNAVWNCFHNSLSHPTPKPQITNSAQPRGTEKRRKIKVF